MSPDTPSRRAGYTIPTAPGVAAAVMEAGGIPRQIGTARDDLESVNAKIDEGIDSDMLITSAGVSKGDFDMVKDVLTKRGSMQFWSVRMRPAKPLAFGLLSAERRVRADGASPGPARQPGQRPGGL